MFQQLMIRYVHAFPLIYFMQFKVYVGKLIIQQIYDIIIYNLGGLRLEQFSSWTDPASI